MTRQTSAYLEIHSIGENRYATPSLTSYGFKFSPTGVTAFEMARVGNASSHTGAVWGVYFLDLLAWIILLAGNDPSTLCQKIPYHMRDAHWPETRFGADFKRSLLHLEMW